MKLKSEATSSVHLIGIGGIGVSSLAQYYLSEGHAVSGSDICDSEIIQDLRAKGISITIGHSPNNIPRGNPLVICTAAVKKENPEYAAAKKRKLKVRTYAEAVGTLTKKYQTIAVCGAHGKSTTTALIALILEKAGIDPTVIIGTKLHEWNGGNFRKGQSEYLVLEADEYKKSFHKYSPKIVIATNIDREHLDHYKKIENIKSAFVKFFSKVPRNGLIILNKDDSHLKEIGTLLLKKKRPVVWYSAEYAIAEKISTSLKLPGTHNLLNALGAYTLARAMKIPEEMILSIFNSYRGSWRRGEYKGKAFGARVFDDYAHHPTEIKATLAGFRELYPMSRIWCVFQPHQEERLRMLFNDFIHSFKEADRIILLDAYGVAGREAGGKGESERKTSFDLARAIDVVANKEVYYFPHAGKLHDFLKEHVYENDLIIMMGAGDINQLTHTLGVLPSTPMV